jgi:hypothetical protein
MNNETPRQVKRRSADWIRKAYSIISTQPKVSALMEFSKNSAQKFGRIVI